MFLVQDEDVVTLVETSAWVESPVCAQRSILA
jgi:hypothetical protein